LEVVAAPTVEDRVVGYMVGLADRAEHVGEVRAKLLMVSQHLLVPQCRGHNDSHPIRVPNLARELLSSHASGSFRGSRFLPVRGQRPGISRGLLRKTDDRQGGEGERGSQDSNLESPVLETGA
jgi:hypothetical protein